MVEKDKPQVPIDIDGLPLASLTPEEHERKKELEFERLMKTSLKGIYNKWSREEKQLVINWAQVNNYETRKSIFKDLVKTFLDHSKVIEHLVLRSMPKIDNSGREIDVWCMHCARVHTFDVPVGFRDTWTFKAPCVLSRRPESGQMKINDTKFPIAKWEQKMLGVDFDKKITNDK